MYVYNAGFYNNIYRVRKSSKYKDIIDIIECDSYRNNHDTKQAYSCYVGGGRRYHALV